MGQIFVAFSENLNFDRYQNHQQNDPFLTHKSLGFYDIISKDPQMIHRLNLCTFLTQIYHHIDKEQKTRLKDYFQDI